MPDVHTIYNALPGMFNATQVGDGMVDPAMEWGNISATTSDENYLRDNKINNNANFTGADDLDVQYRAGVRFDMGANKSVDFFAFYLPAILTGYTIYLYGSANATTDYSSLGSVADPVAGWSIVTFNSASKRYFVAQIQRGSSFSNIQIAEVLFGAELELKKFLKGGNRDADEGVTVRKSEGGNEYSVMNYPSEKRIRSEGIGGIDESLKDDLIAFKTAVRAVLYAYLIYFNDDEEYWWVRSKPGSFKIQNNGGIYQTSFTVVEQLS